MKTLLVPALLFVIGGCVVQGPPDNTPVEVAGDVNVIWRFSDGNNCSSLGGVVDHLQIDIPNQALANGGAFSCEIAGTQGVELTDFAPGTYSIAVTAVDSTGSAVYTWSGSFTVNGDVEVDALLVPVTAQQQPGNVTVLWSFTDGQSCGSLGGAVDHIEVSIPGQVLQNAGAFPCETAGSQGIELDNFDPGDYNISVQAYDPSGSPSYSFSGSFTVDGDVTVQVPLAPLLQTLAPGNITFTWTFGDGNTCGSLGPNVSDIHVSIPGQTLQNNGDYPCETAGSQGIEVDDFAGGDYSFTIEALDPAGNVIYGSSGNFQVNGNVEVDATLVAQ